MARIMIVWGLWGPYHCRRFEAFRDHAEEQGHEATGISLFSGSRDYQWRSESLPEKVIHFDLGADETRFPLRRVVRLLAIPWKVRPDVALLPSYDHWSLALNGAMRAFGGRVVMMNDTHAGTARARGLKAAFKRQVVAGFHAGFVAGAPQRRYFSSLGLPEHKIFTGYDAVDNDYYASWAKEVRNAGPETRTKYGLPPHYFLSLGRFVPKKNLTALIHAYRRVLDSSRDCQTHLVLVGSGEEDLKLRSLCRELRLPVYEKAEAGETKADSGANRTDDAPPGVHFYGFRQIEENPVFYALADAFVLPSLWEEWGLVVNEAMACGLPVVVSRTAGCAEDLLPPGTHGRLPDIGIRQNGFVFDPESPDSLARALIALASDTALREGMGNASRAVVGNFSCDVFARNALMAARAANGEAVYPQVDASSAREPVGAGSGLIR
ncbi:MAG TPA: glycosyltransferase family 4 protein [Candidatus Baltobacteraceae bacterium]|jgi:glycosyltransferase involved in cell wall biosynthesis|nr:glycosyltransferase family 4 protein [Candidatus Baltobacteraceae bacterium]